MARPVSMRRRKAALRCLARCAIDIPRKPLKYQNIRTVAEPVGRLLFNADQFQVGWQVVHRGQDMRNCDVAREVDGDASVATHVW